MLPTSVADNLKQNKNTSEMFDSATICFTEITDFKLIGRSCTPLQLFDLLNTLYRTFDARIGNYDVYKVETIGDAYMVASGVPVSNGSQHAVEVSRMSLDLLAKIVTFEIKHKPGFRLKLRMGMHSGKVVGGVVGSKIPHYSVFGLVAVFGLDYMEGFSGTQWRLLA